MEKPAEPEVALTFVEWFYKYIFTLETVYMIYGWPYFAVNAYFSTWKLQYNHEESEASSLTFLEAFYIAEE